MSNLGNISQVRNDRWTNVTRCTYYFPTSLLLFLLGHFDVYTKQKIGSSLVDYNFANSIERDAGCTMRTSKTVDKSQRSWNLVTTWEILLHVWEQTIYKIIAVDDRGRFCSFSLLSNFCCPGNDSKWVLTQVQMRIWINSSSLNLILGCMESFPEYSTENFLSIKRFLLCAAFPCKYILMCLYGFTFGKSQWNYWKLLDALHLHDCMPP